jgi:lantibiotic modifying enzyme
VPAWAAIHTIARSLRSSSVAGASLAGGASGVALFYAYLAEATGQQEDAETAVRLLESAIPEYDGADAALFEGRTGVAWVLAHLDGWVLDLADEDSHQALEGALLALLDGPPIEDHDLVSGLVGFGVYACERLPGVTARAALDRIVTRLGNLAEEDGAGLGWFTPAQRLSPAPRRLSPAGHWDLGMAHGAAGVVAFLAHARAVGATDPAADDLVGPAAEWLVRQQLPPESPSRYGPWLAPDQPPRPARSAWCYGDPGVAVALLAAGRREEALEVARAAASRPLENCGVVDGGLCHGAAGLLHVFNRLHQATGEDILAEAARRWFDQALVLPVDEDGFLEGRAGVGLALLAAATAIEPAWDRVLLLSGPGERRA